jgi:Protein of unknown function (DUF3037)
MTTALYSIVRFVPNEIRDESVNIGVILEDRQQSRLYSAFALNFSRVAKLDGSLPRSTLERFLKSYIERLTHYTLDGETSLTSLVEWYSAGKVQLTVPRSTILRTTAEDEMRSLQQLFLDEE